MKITLKEGIIKSGDPLPSNENYFKRRSYKVKATYLKVAFFQKILGGKMILKLYEVDNDYIDYLKKYDKKVLNYSGEKYKVNRKYLGILLKINEFIYIAPLSSPKNKDYDLDKKIKKSTKIIIRIKKIQKDKERLLGTIKLNCMIPIYNTKAIKKYDVKAEKDKKYKNLIQEQLVFIRKEEKMIIKRAENLYKQKLKNPPYLKDTVNFILLEEKSKKYINNYKNY